MGNKSSAELWESWYKLQEKEFLSFNDVLTEKFQMGELDSQDKKAIQKFKDEFHASINADRTKLVDAIWQVYGDKGKMGRDHTKSIVKDALTHGKSHLPRILVALTEVEAMRTTQKDSTALMLDKEARPLLEKSLERIRRDCGDRVKNSLGESLDDAGTLGDSLLLRLTTAPPTADKKEGKAPVLDTKALVKQDAFMKLFHASLMDAIGLKELIQSVLAQFTNFLQIELRNIPLRVIKKLEEQEEERERAESASEQPKKA
jgi:hypothetical protein